MTQRESIEDKLKQVQLQNDELITQIECIKSQRGVSNIPGQSTDFKDEVDLKCKYPRFSF